jgi:CPA1 family monovalent cation:H+ antiporter
MIFGAVIFSLLAQGLTISPLLRWLRITKPQPELKAYEMARGKLLAETAALGELDQLHDQGLVTERVYSELRPMLERSREELSQRLSGLDIADHDADLQLKTRMMRHLIAVKKARSTTLLREGLLSEETWRELNETLDEDLAGLLDDSTLTEALKEEGKFA